MACFDFSDFGLISLSLFLTGLPLLLSGALSPSLSLFCLFGSPEDCTREGLAEIESLFLEDSLAGLICCDSTMMVIPFLFLGLRIRISLSSSDGSRFFFDLLSLRCTVGLLLRLLTLASLTSPFDLLSFGRSCRSTSLKSDSALGDLCLDFCLDFVLVLLLSSSLLRGGLLLCAWLSSLLRDKALALLLCDWSSSLLLGELLLLDRFSLVSSLLRGGLLLSDWFLSLLRGEILLSDRSLDFVLSLLRGGLLLGDWLSFLRGGLLFGDWTLSLLRGGLRFDLDA